MLIRVHNITNTFDKRSKDYGKVVNIRVANKQRIENVRIAPNESKIITTVNLPYDLTMALSKGYITYEKVTQNQLNNEQKIKEKQEIQNNTTKETKTNTKKTTTKKSYRKKNEEKDEEKSE